MFEIPSPCFRLARTHFLGVIIQCGSMFVWFPTRSLTHLICVPMHCGSMLFVILDPYFFRPALNPSCLYSAVDSYEYLNGTPLECPIYSFGGIHDGELDIGAWAMETLSDKSESVRYPGCGFYLLDPDNEVLYPQRAVPLPLLLHTGAAVGVAAFESNYRLVQVKSPKYIHRRKYTPFFRFRS